MKKKLVFGMAFLFGCSSISQQPNWLARSNQIAEEFTRSMSVLTPELGSSLGYKEFDVKGMNLTETSKQEENEILQNWRERLIKEIEITKSEDLKVDLLILLEKVENSLKWNEIDMQLGAIPFYAPSKSIYTMLLNLINDQSPKKRKYDVVTRFKYYMSDAGKDNLIRAYQKDIIRYQKKYSNKKTFYVFQGELDKYLIESPSYIVGIKELLSQSGRDDWQNAYEIFVKETSSFDDFLKKEIRPKARKTPYIPKEVYVMILKGVGVNSDPYEMIQIGKSEYKKKYNEFEILANTIAQKNNLKEKNPSSVIKFLKKKQVTSEKEVSDLYHLMTNRLEKIIIDNKLVSLPSQKLKIRFAGDAESKAKPVPHLVPPPIIDNNGILPEFVVPTSSTGKLPFDDFSFESSATILSAHEGRPGHDLQFSRMLEVPTSIIRARYAMNSVNVEGWALYAEDLVYPFLTDEEKLIALQARLWRVARYFLDPMVNLEKISSDNITKIFHDELGVSKEMSELEYQRYAFRDPGQATAYYQGLLNIQELKNFLVGEYGEFNLKCFNDTLLSFGMMPHGLIKLFKEKFQKCSLR